MIKFLTVKNSLAVSSVNSQESLDTFYAILCEHIVSRDHRLYESESGWDTQRENKNKFVIIRANQNI